MTTRQMIAYITVAIVQRHKLGLASNFSTKSPKSRAFKKKVDIVIIMFNILWLPLYVKLYCF